MLACCTVLLGASERTVLDSSSSLYYVAVHAFLRPASDFKNFGGCPRIKRYSHLPGSSEAPMRLWLRWRTLPPSLRTTSQ